MPMRDGEFVNYNLYAILKFTNTMVLVGRESTAFHVNRDTACASQSPKSGVQNGFAHHSDSV